MKTIKRKYKKKTPRQRLKAKLDKMWQEIVSTRQGYRCELCGGTPACGHHIIFKSQSLYLHWDLKNAIVLCSSCHYKVHNVDPRKMNKKIDKRIGESRVEYLEKHRHDLFMENKKNYDKVERALARECAKLNSI